MAESSQPEPAADLVRERIIGLGESSVRKSYYPQLQEKIRALEVKQQELMATVRSLEEHESELERLIQEKNVLLHEVHHRVKNNLQIIGSLLSLGGDNLVTESEIRSFADTRRRVDTIALIYNQLLQGEQYSDLAASELARIVGEALFLEAGLAELELVYELSPSGSLLDMDKAVPFALIVSELVSNAIAHGCPEGRGRIVIRLGPDPEKSPPHVREMLCVEDNGPGLADYTTKAAYRSMGFTLVDILARQLKAEWSMTPGASGRGLRASLWLPAAADALPDEIL